MPRSGSQAQGCCRSPSHCNEPSRGGGPTRRHRLLPVSMVSHRLCFFVIRFAVSLSHQFPRRVCPIVRIREQCRRTQGSGAPGSRRVITSRVIDRPVSPHARISARLHLPAVRPAFPQVRADSLVGEESRLMGRLALCSARTTLLTGQRTRYGMHTQSALLFGRLGSPESACNCAGMQVGAVQAFPSATCA